MHILLIEDEKIALENLVHLTMSYKPNSQIVGQLKGVSEAVNWFKSNPMPDLIFMDIQLNDGVSFDIFKTVTIQCPVIFTTSYDDYLLNAFDSNGIDYILKPLSAEKIKQAFEKYERMKSHFQMPLLENLGTSHQFKDRIVAKKGIEYYSLPTNQISYLYSENKMTYLINSENQRFIVDYTLSDLENVLNQKEFFRVNRQCITHVNAIRKFKSIEKGKIQIVLHPESQQKFIISQENASSFKHWLGR